MFKLVVISGIALVSTAMHRYSQISHHQLRSTMEPVSVTGLAFTVLFLMIVCAIIWYNEKRAALNARRNYQAADTCETPTDERKLVGTPKSKETEEECLKLVCIQGRTVSRQPIQD